MAHNPEAIRRLTRSYRFLRGYEQIPFAFWAIAPQALDRQFPGYLLAFGLVTAVTMAATHAIKGYYDRRFGVVATAGGHGWRIAVGVVGFFALQFVSNGFGLRVQLGFLAVGVAVAIYALRRFELEWQKLFVAVFLMIISVWPPIADPRAPSQLWQTVFVYGFPPAWIAMSIWDHRTLVKTFERARLAATSGAH